MAANIGYMRNACGSGDPAEVETVCGEFCALPKELALGHGSLHRAKLHSLPEMCAPAHSFVVSAVAITARSVLTDHRPILPPATSGTSTSPGSGKATGVPTSGVADCSQIILPVELEVMKSGSIWS